VPANSGSFPFDVCRVRRVAQRETRPQLAQWRHHTPKRADVSRKSSERNGYDTVRCIELTGGDMAEPAEGHEELVKVFDTDEESEAMVVRGLLETAGIEAMTQNREAPQDILPGVGGVVVMVRPDQAEEALATIEAYRAQPATDEDEAVSEEPAQP
jgi:hypothetical protein